jgi:ketosteroid isomerase-like protein
MRIRRAFLTALFLATLVSGHAQESSQDQLQHMTRDWLQAIGAGNRDALNKIMDPKFIATTPAGDVLTKERLVPNDADHPAQKLPPLELDGPLVRVYGDTGVLMTRLKPAAGDGPSMNGTFVFAREADGWKLVAMQLSAQK